PATESSLRVRPERIASRQGPGLNATLVSRAGEPRVGAQVVLVNAEQPRWRHTLQTDERGAIDVPLAPGEGLVYTRTADGRAVLPGPVAVGPDGPARVVLRED